MPTKVDYFVILYGLVRNAKKTLDPINICRFIFVRSCGRAVMPGDTLELIISVLFFVWILLLCQFGRCCLRFFFGSNKDLTNSLRTGNKIIIVIHSSHEWTIYDRSQRRGGQIFSCEIRLSRYKINPAERRQFRFYRQNLFNIAMNWSTHQRRAFNGCLLFCLFSLLSVALWSPSFARRRVQR